MPGRTSRHKRAVESSEEEDEHLDITTPARSRQSTSSPRSSARKRARRNPTEKTESSSEVDGDEREGDGGSPASEEQEDVYSHGGAVRDDSPRRNSGDEASDDSGEKFQPGSIVRVKLENFVTYSSAEFFPGPSLNMVIGPNGTGKSTLVCAICLGLGWGPQHLGRAKDVSEYVKRGCHDATIEIELAGRSGDGNPTIRRQIKREGNKSQFWIDGRPSPLKAVLELARSFSIQIDNLCQFLPQDKVCEFAALTPVELLQSTQRAAAPPHMVEWHENLKTLRAEQRRIQAQNDVDKETLTDLDGRQQILKADVDNLRERAAIQQRLKLLETSRPFAKYRQARLKVQEAKELKKKAQNELQALEREVEPSLRAVNAKQDYSKQVEKVVHARKKALEDGETHADRMVREQRDIHEKFQDLEREVAAEKEGGKARKQEIVRIDAKIKSLQRQMEQEPVDFDPAAYNERIREKVRRVKEMQLMVSQLRDAQTELKRQSAEKAERVRQMETELQELDSQVGQQAAKLRQRSQDTARAWEWIQNNQDMFEHPVFGPPIVECSVTDSRYVDAIESLLGANDLLTFTVQSNNDFKKLGDQLYGSMKLAEITIRTSTIKLDQFKPPVSAEQRATFGFDGWALDFLAGPDPVLAMMCSESRAHSTGIALNDISSRQYEALERSPITTWTTGKASYQIVRRAEYGPSATSTRVRELAKAKVWTNQPVDMAAKTELRRSIDELKVDRDELARQIQEASQKILEIQQNARVIDGEKKVLEEEKAAKQRAQGEFRALPAKLAQLEDDIAAKKNSRSEAMIRLTELHERIDERLFEKCDVGLRYATHVQTLLELHSSLLLAQVVHAEALSDLSTLTNLNLSVRQSLETKRAEVATISANSATVTREARALLNECTTILDSPETAQSQREFMATLPANQTPDELSSEIESTRARLELLHDDNPNAITEFEARAVTITSLDQKIARTTTKLTSLGEAIAEIQHRWEPELDRLIDSISQAFSHSFSRIGCAGQVGIFKDGLDFENWAIQIQVKFREDEPLSLLTSHRQSGGERAVSTIFYLMSLQSLARAPFRVVDEINQGMDPRNERVVHERMVDIACREHTSQYFLITPKLLWGLRYHERMRVLCIASGEFMPGEETKRRGLDAGLVIRRRDELQNERAAVSVGA